MATKEEAEYMAKLKDAYESAEMENNRLKKEFGQVSMFSGGGDTSNLIVYQLDLSEELERIEHLLKGEVIKRRQDGSEYWAESQDERLKPFNEYGVQLILKVVSFYLNRGTILSNYSEEMINWKMKDLGDELADLIFMKYDEMGMDTEDKRKLFPMIVREIVDTIHSAYLRALKGGERESLRTARHVTQTDSMSAQLMNQPPKARFNPLKPSTWKG